MNVLVKRLPLLHRTQSAVYMYRLVSSSYTKISQCHPLFVICLLFLSVCTDSLGMEDGRIQDSQITASSVYVSASAYAHGAKHARLNHVVAGTIPGAWVAADGNKNVSQWIQVDLGVPRLVSGMVVQGRDTHDQWVTKYNVEYSHDGNSWQYVQDIDATGIQQNKVRQYLLEGVPSKRILNIEQYE